MEAIEILDEADIVFSDSAANRVAQLIKEEKNPDLRLRVYITGGGCSGFSYGFTFDENLKEGDSGVNKKGASGRRHHWCNRTRTKRRRRK